jgi:hypothetical protein
MIYRSRHKLEIKKLEKEIQQLSEPWWKRNVTSLFQLIVAILALLVGYITGFFDVRAERLDLEATRLENKRDSLQIYIQKVNSQKDSVVADYSAEVALWRDSVLQLAALNENLKYGKQFDTVLLETIVELGLSKERRIEIWNEGRTISPYLLGSKFNEYETQRSLQGVNELQDFPEDGVFVTLDGSRTIIAPADASVGDVQTDYGGYIALEAGDIKFEFKGIFPLCIQKGQMVKKGDAIALATYDDRFFKYTLGYGVKRLKNGKWVADQAEFYLVPDN